MPSTDADVARAAEVFLDALAASTGAYWNDESQLHVRALSALPLITIRTDGTADVSAIALGALTVMEYLIGMQLSKSSGPDRLALVAELREMVHFVEQARRRNEG